jgi:hypothetical protein
MPPIGSGAAVLKIGEGVVKQLGEQSLPPDFPLIVGHHTDTSR